MSGTTLRHFNLPWHQHDHYWIGFYAVNGAFHPHVGAVLTRCGAVIRGDGYVLRTGRQWKQVWETAYEALRGADALPQVVASLSYGEDAPASRQDAQCSRPSEIQELAESLWLGDALTEGRVICYLQSVHSSKERIFGYESFVRARMPDGKVASGVQIIAASRALGIEHMIDRHLHGEAIRTFAASAFNGFLFVNFFPGFIHRPAVYLEGLNDAARASGVVSRHIVLDLTNSEKPRDILHIRSVCDYGRSRGYSVALDDVASVAVAERLVRELRPDFVKIDMHLVRDAGAQPARDTIRAIVELVHGAGGTVIAEGVETEEIFQAVKLLGVDLFQGYLFSAPEPVEMALKLGTEG